VHDLDETSRIQQKAIKEGNSDSGKCVTRKIPFSLCAVSKVRFIGRAFNLVNSFVLTGTDKIVVDVRICNWEAAVSFSRSGIDRRDETRSL